MSIGFGKFVEGLTYEALPEPVLWTLRRSFVDTMGVAAVGSTTELSAISRRVAPLIFGAGGSGSARMLMDGAEVSAAGAAMAGGCWKYRRRPVPVATSRMRAGNPRNR